MRPNVVSLTEHDRKAGRFARQREEYHVHDRTMLSHKTRGIVLPTCMQVYASERRRRVLQSLQYSRTLLQPSLLKYHTVDGESARNPTTLSVSVVECEIRLDDIPSWQSF